jgi:hypothetical protein
MPFDESLKTSVRRRAHFACCLCHDLGVEVHHIVPEGEGGPNDPENAAPLCPTCHERYGANPVKRKFIREARNLWFDICDRRFAPDKSAMSEIQTALSRVATKGDIEEAVDAMRSAAVGLPIENREVLPAELEKKPISPDSIKEYVRFMFPVVAHSGPEDCAALANDLTDIGYEDIAGLHAMVGYTSQPFAEVVQQERDKGEARMDTTPRPTIRTCTSATWAFRIANRTGAAALVIPFQGASLRRASGLVGLRPATDRSLGCQWGASECQARPVLAGFNRIAPGHSNTDNKTETHDLSRKAPTGIDQWKRPCPSLSLGCCFARGVLNAAGLNRKRYCRVAFRA